MENYFIELENHQVNICEWGDASLPQIICFHGLGSTKLSFIEIAESLKHHYHIVSFDLPGHGRSTAFSCDEAYNAVDIDQWVSQVIDYVGQKEFFVLAHSWGASVALHYAASHPERLIKMLLLDGGYHDFKMNDAYFKKLASDGLVNPPPCSLEASIDYYEHDFDDYVFENLESFLASEKNNYSRWSDLIEVAVMDLKRVEDGLIKYHATGDTARAIIKYQYKVYNTLNFQQIQTPIRLLYCDQPKIYLPIRTQMVEAFSKLVEIETKLYENTGHLMHWDQPEAVINDISMWFVI